MGEIGSKLEVCVGLSHDVMHEFCSRLELAARKGGFSKIYPYLPPSVSTLLGMEHLHSAVLGGSGDIGSAASDAPRLASSIALLAVSRSFLRMMYTISSSPSALQQSGLSYKEVQELAADFLTVGAGLFNLAPYVPLFHGELASAVAFKQHVLEAAQSTLYCLAVQALHQDMHVEASRAHRMIGNSIRLTPQDG